jgi:tetratricopeptide (TPR) repeat protein
MNLSIIRIITLLVLTTGLGHSNVRSLISSGFLARGEQAVFEIRVEGQEPDEMPQVPRVEGVDIEAIGYGRPQMYPGRRIESSFRFLVSSYEVGIHIIPGVEVLVNGAKFMTEPVRIEIFDPGDLVWSEAASEPAEIGDTVRYASIIRIPQRKFFENQAFESEIKIYVPRDIARSVADWGVPEFERKGLAVWRYEPSDPPGAANLLGQPYVSLSYKTTMTALAAGEVEIGPATVRLIYVKTVFDRFAQRMQLQATLDIPRLGFEVSPLPAGAPEGFDNAVGNFTIATAIKETDVTEGEPIALDVIVSGAGNLDNLRSPEMSDASGWKVYDATPNQRGEERRELSGTVVFSQFIRPLEMKAGVPPFRLVFFDPDTEKYETVTTELIQLAMSPAKGSAGFQASGPPQALPLPVERMSDILGLIDTSDLLAPAGKRLPPWFLHAMAAVLSLALIARALWIRYGHLFERDEAKRALKRDLEALSRAVSGDGLAFLRAAGGFAERWQLVDKNDEVRDMLDERDRLCFREAKSDVPVPKGRREKILRSLRRAALGLLLFTLMPISVEGGEVSTKAKEAYDSARFEEAARLWLEAGSYADLSADTLYNIGNAAYRMGAPGQAALYYRRALARDSAHGEARQNLRFIERKYGAITVERPAYQYVIARIPLSAWKNGLWMGAWMVVLGFLLFPATRPGSRWRVVGVVGFVLGPLMMSMGALGWRYFPDDAGFAPIARQAVVTGEKVVLHTDAARTSPEVIDAPPGSIAEVIRRSGDWAYVAFATKTRGWVLIDSIEMVIPSTKPEPPKLKKTAADGSSA